MNRNIHPPQQQLFPLRYRHDLGHHPPQQQQQQQQLQSVIVSPLPPYNNNNNKARGRSRSPPRRNDESSRYRSRSRKGEGEKERFPRYDDVRGSNKKFYTNHYNGHRYQNQNQQNYNNNNNNYRYRNNSNHHHNHNNHSSNKNEISMNKSDIIKLVREETQELNSQLEKVKSELKAATSDIKEVKSDQVNFNKLLIQFAADQTKLLKSPEMNKFTPEDRSKNFETLFSQTLHYIALKLKMQKSIGLDCIILSWKDDYENSQLYALALSASRRIPVFVITEYKINYLPLNFGATRITTEEDEVIESRVKQFAIERKHSYSKCKGDESCYCIQICKCGSCGKKNSDIQSISHLFISNLKFSNQVGVKPRIGLISAFPAEISNCFSKDKQIIPILLDYSTGLPFVLTNEITVQLDVLLEEALLDQIPDNEVCKVVIDPKLQFLDNISSASSRGDIKEAVKHQQQQEQNGDGDGNSTEEVIEVDYDSSSITLTGK